MALGFCDGVVEGGFSGCLTAGTFERSCMGLEADDLVKVYINIAV